MNKKFKLIGLSIMTTGEKNHVHILLLCPQQCPTQSQTVML